LGCYGYGKDTSPNIDEMAANGACFGNAFAQSNWTYPSFYSMFSGRYPSVLRVSAFDQKIDSSVRLLPERLAKAGFATAIFSGFKVLLNQDAFSGHFNERACVCLDDAPKTISDWFAVHDDAFLLFHEIEYIHEPFHACDELVDEFLPDSSIRSKALSNSAVRSLTTASDKGGDLRRAIGRVNKRLDRLSSTDIEYMLACYNAGIRRVDRDIAAIRSAVLDQPGENMLIVCSDHGQMFMEHGLFGHGLSVHDEVLRVPLVIEGTGIRQGMITECVQLLDIFPTIFEFAGLENADPCDGRSLMPALSETLIKAVFVLT